MRRFIILGVALAALIVTGLLTISTQQPQGITAQDDAAIGATSEGVSLTVYNEGTALVQDRRTFTLEQGINSIDFTDVASSIDPTSVSFTSLTDPSGTVVMEQNYVYDLVDANALVRRYVDEVIEVTALNSDGGIETLRGELLAGSGGEIILRQDDGQVVVIGGANIRDIRFPELPGGLITRPTLRWLLASQMSGDQQVELTYLTGGVSWTADYIVLLAADNDALDLNGWVTLNNQSGTSYQDAQLKLIAGDVNRLPQARDFAADEIRLEAAAAPVSEAAVAQREFFEYNLYEINRPVTVGNRETKQVEFVSGAGVPATTFFVYDSQSYFNGYFGPITDAGYGLTGITDVQNYLEFTTDAEFGLGADLPAGRIRVYQEDIDGAALLIGENRIDHTPEGEDLQIYLGNAFDLVGEKVQTDFTLVATNVIEETYEISLRNRKEDETVEIRVPERLFRWSNWEILDATHSFEQISSSQIEFRVMVPPQQEVILSYRVRYTWPN